LNADAGGNGSAAIAKEGSLAWNIATPTAPSSWSRITRRIFRSGLRAAAAYRAGAAAAYRAWVTIEYRRREMEPNRAPAPRVFFAQREIRKGLVGGFKC